MVGRLNVAMTVVSARTVVAQVPVPEQPPPLQPVKVEPLAGVAVRVTVPPLVTDSEQSVPQFTPGPVTVPEPVPLRVTARVYAVGDALGAVAHATFV